MSSTEVPPDFCTETLTVAPWRDSADAISAPAASGLSSSVSGGSMTSMSVFSASMMKGRASKAARAASLLPFQASSTCLKVVTSGPACGTTSTGRPAS
nr:hypothetical protein [Mesorhizobium sp. LNHC221B00]